MAADRFVWGLLSDTAKLPINSSMESRLLHYEFGGLGLRSVRAVVLTSQRGTMSPTGTEEERTVAVSLLGKKRARKFMDYDPRTYFALNTIMVSRVAWSWAHGYYTPKGWPAYYIRKVVPCKHCKLDHCDSVWAVLCICTAPQAHRWREILLDNVAFEREQRTLWSSMSLDEKKTTLRLRCSSRLFDVLRERGGLIDEIIAAFVAVAPKFLRAVQKVCQEAKITPEESWS